MSPAPGAAGCGGAGKVPRDGPGRLRAGCGGAAGTGRVPPGAVVVHPGRVAAGPARSARSQPGLLRPNGQVRADLPAGSGRGRGGLMSDSVRAGLAGPAGAGHGPGLARPASRGLRNTLPGAHAEPSEFSPCKMPLGASRRAHLARRTRTAGPCGDRQGFFRDSTRPDGSHRQFQGRRGKRLAPHSGTVPSRSGSLTT